MAKTVAPPVNSPVVAEPPVREKLPRDVVLQHDHPTREEIDQEVKELMSPANIFDADVVVAGHNSSLLVQIE